MSDLSYEPKRLAICTSDWHLRETVPENRLPGFTHQQLNKVRVIMNLCRKHDADLYNAGDLYNTARPPRYYTNKVQGVLSCYPDVKHFACAGQHDQIYHSSNLADTSIQSLYSSGLIHQIDTERIRTVNWGGDVESEVDILIAHFCVTEKPIEFIDYSLTAKQFIEKTNAKLIVTGDYHVAHHMEHNGTLLVNPGSIVRMGIDSIKRKPSVYLVDTAKCEIVDQIFLPIEPAEEVFDIEGVDKQKTKQKHREELTARFDKYIQQATTKQKQPDFEENLEDVIRTDLPSEEARTEIDFILEEVR